jgi:hypothetical protein
LEGDVLILVTWRNVTRTILGNCTFVAKKENLKFINEIPKLTNQKQFNTSLALFDSAKKKKPNRAIVYQATKPTNMKANLIVALVFGLLALGLVSCDDKVEGPVIGERWKSRDHPQRVG